jgi:hypothetical protein
MVIRLRSPVAIMIVWLKVPRLVNCIYSFLHGYLLVVSVKIQVLCALTLPVPSMNNNASWINSQIIYIHFGQCFI